MEKENFSLLDQAYKEALWKKEQEINAEVEKQLRQKVFLGPTANKDREAEILRFQKIREQQLTEAQNRIQQRIFVDFGGTRAEAQKQLLGEQEKDYQAANENSPTPQQIEEEKKRNEIRERFNMTQDHDRKRDLGRSL